MKKQKGYVYTPGYKRHTFLKILLIFGIGFASGMFHQEIVSFGQRTYESINR